MIQSLLDMLDGLGLVGLLIVMGIEGSSFPFPGVFLVLTYGYLLNLTTPELVASAFLMSLVYSATSYIPYVIGFKLERVLPKRFKQKIDKAQGVFRQYGLWSIALTRPFSVGNYISYVAGMFRVKAWRYGFITFLGVFPWSVAMLLLGRVFKGNVEAVVSFFQQYQWYLYAGIIAAVLAYVSIVYFRRNRRGIRSAGGRGGSD